MYHLRRVAHKFRAHGQAGLELLEAGEPDEGIAVEVKLRSAQAPVAGRLTLDGQGGGAVTLAEPAYGVAPGQACVFYRGERVLGGGWIKRRP